MRIVVACTAPDEYADANDPGGLTAAGLDALIYALGERGFADVDVRQHDAAAP